MPNDTTLTSRAWPCTYPSNQSSVNEYTAIEMANFSGFSHAGTPVMIVGSTIRPTRATKSIATEPSPTIVSGGFATKARRT